MMEQANNGVAWLILNPKLWKESKSAFKKEDLWTAQPAPARPTMLPKTKKATTPGALALWLGFDNVIFHDILG